MLTQRLFFNRHFPINVNLEKRKSEEGNDYYDVEIRNFLGEKRLRTVQMAEGVTVEQPKNEKDTLWLMGNSIDDVSQSAASIQGSCAVKNKDIRKVKTAPADSNPECTADIFCSSWTVSTSPRRRTRWPSRRRRTICTVNLSQNIITHDYAAVKPGQHIWLHCVEPRFVPPSIRLSTSVLDVFRSDPDRIA